MITNKLDKTDILNKRMVLNISYLNKEYIRLEKQGYITEDGEPLKCLYCDSKKLVDVNMIVGNDGVEKYEVKCNNCGEITGRWIYGLWAIVI